MRKVENKRAANGTSFFGRVGWFTVNQLKKVADDLGAEYFEDNDGNEKSNYRFKFMTEEGEVFTVYDWKEYKPLDPTVSYEFHIGGFSKEATHNGFAELFLVIVDNLLDNIEKNIEDYEEAGE